MNIVAKRLGPWAIPVLAVSMGGLGVSHVMRETRGLPPVDPPIQPARSPYDHAIGALGIVEARSENIEVGSALSGVVLEVHVPSSAVGRQVEAGDPLFRVDDRDLNAELAAARSRLEAARRRLERLEQQPRAEEIPPSAARVEAARRRVALTFDKLERARRLVGREAVSDETVIERELEHQIAKSELDRFEAEHALLLAGAWEPELAIARAAVDEARADARRLEVEIERATVRAPIDGRVLRVDLQPGERVEARAEQPLMVLGDVERLHVRVEIDEEEISRLRSAAPAIGYPRGDGGRSHRLRFVRLEPLVVPKRSLTGLGGERVDTRVLQAIYEVEGSGAGLFVGQQLDVFLEAKPIEGGSESPAEPSESPGSNQSTPFELLYNKHELRSKRTAKK